jgi:hypothetical protein
MDISRYAVNAESIDTLSKYQITNFFRRHESITKDDCNHTATSIIGSPVSLTLVQGAGSYTVLADVSYPSKVVQFRDSPLNLELLNQARQTYGEFVPTCKPCDKLADLYVYEMDFVPGVSFSRVRRQLLAPEMESRLLQTVQDFARSVDVYTLITLSYLLIRRLDSSHRRGSIGQPWGCHRILPAICSPIIPGFSTSFPKACLSASIQS